MDIDFSELEGFDWDKGNLGHIKKHNVDRLECEEVFSNNPFRVNEDLEHSSQAEVRFQALGQTNEGRRLFLSFTIRINKIRIISARDQNKKERRQYEQKT